MDIDEQVSKIIDLIDDNKITVKYCNLTIMNVDDSNISNIFDEDFDDCDYNDIIKTVPYSLIYQPKNRNKNKNIEKQKRSENYYKTNPTTFHVTKSFIDYLQKNGFKQTIKKIYYYYVDNGNTSFYKILGKSHIMNNEIYFYTEYQEHSLGFHNHKLYFSYNYFELIKYCMPKYHVENFTSMYKLP